LTLEEIKKGESRNCCLLPQGCLTLGENTTTSGFFDSAPSRISRQERNRAFLDALAVLIFVLRHCEFKKRNREFFVPAPAHKPTSSSSISNMPPSPQPVYPPRRAGTREDNAIVIDEDDANTASRVVDEDPSSPQHRSRGTSLHYMGP
jgi:hypothetical protein